MSFVNSNVTLFAIVEYDHSAGQNRIVGVQTNAAPLLCAEIPTAAGAWSINSVNLGLPVDLFRTAVDPTVVNNRVGSIALNLSGLAVTVDAAPFVNNATATVGISVPNTVGDGLATVHNLTVHLRALSGRRILLLSGGGSVLLGSGSSAATGRLLASGIPNSDAIGASPAWNQVHWHAITAGASFVPGANTLSTEVGGVAGDVDFRLASGTPIPANDIGATFNGLASNTLLNSVTTFTCGVSDLQIVAGATPTVAVNGLQNEVGVSPGAGKAVNFQIQINDATYVSWQNVNVEVRFTPRDAGAVATTATYSWNAAGAVVVGTAPPAGATVNMQAATRTGTLPPIDPAPAAWSGNYTGKLTSSTQLSFGSGVPAGNNTINLTDGRFKEVRIRVSAVNHAGNTTGNVDHFVDVNIPIDVVVALDYSGSMLMDTLGNAGPTTPGNQRWDAAKGAANLFHAVYRLLEPVLAGADGLNHKVGYVRFWWDGDDATGSNQTTAVVPLTGVAAGPATAMLVTDPPPPAWLQWTPIGEGIKTAYAQLSDPGNSGWRRRTIVLMTDGHENRSVTLNTIRTTVAAGANYVPNLAEDATNGITIHSCSFGPAGSTDVDKLNTLSTGDGMPAVRNYGGQLHETSTADPEESAAALSDAFLDMFVDVFAPSVNRLVSVVPPAAMTIGAGVARAVLVLTTEAAASLAGPTAALEGAAGGSAAGSGIRWWTIVNPTAGNYTVTLAAAPAIPVSLHGLVDLQLKAGFEVEGTSVVGSTFTLRATITDARRPVSGVDVRVKVKGPGLSEGLLLERAATLNRISGTLGKVKDLIKSPDAFNPRYAMLKAAQAQLGITATQGIFTAGGIPLVERADRPGTYEAKFSNTANEGAYSFEFTAHGHMLDAPKGCGCPPAFNRQYKVSRYVHPVPDPVATGVVWIPGRITEKLQSWTLHIKPTTSTGAPTGSGRDYSVKLEGFDRPVQLVDQLDGSYAAVVELDPLAPLPGVTLVGSIVDVPLARTVPQGGAKRVRVILERVQIKEAHESFGDPGEIYFDAVVAPNADRAYAVRRRIPEQGVLELRDGDTADVKTLLFEGLVEEGSTLMIAIGASEHDVFPSGDERTEMMATYRRTLSGPISTWAGAYVPGDEKREDEELADWRLWYRVDVL